MVWSFCGNSRRSASNNVWFGMASADCFVFCTFIAIDYRLASIQKNAPVENTHPTLNKRGEELVGRIFTLNKPIIDN